MQVHHDHLGRELPHQAHGLGAAPRLADDLHAPLLEQVSQARPEEVVVVHEEDANVLDALVALV